MLTVLDLFSGIGGFSLGLERTGGFKTIAFCEVEAFCRKILNKHWPTVPIIPDITREFSPFVAASPVRTFPRLESAPALPGSVQDSGGIWWEPFAWFDRDTQSWRTWQRCLDQGWEPFSETWPRSGMTRNGIAYRRPPLVHLTDATEFGLLPTPEASNTKAKAMRSGGRSPRDFTKPWPTPRANDAERGGRGDLIQAVRGNQNSHFKTWPTPIARDSRTIKGGGGSHEELNGLGAADNASCGSGGRHDWSAEPDVGRVAHGVPSRVDRLRSLGNAVVPQIPEIIGYAILEAEKSRSDQHPLRNQS